MAEIEVGEAETVEGFAAEGAVVTEEGSVVATEVGEAIGDEAVEAVLEEEDQAGSQEGKDFNLKSPFKLRLIIIVGQHIQLS